MSLGTASLEVLVKTEDVKRAQGDLNRLADSGRNVDQAIKVTESRMKTLDEATRRVAKELRTMREINRAAGSTTSQYSAEILKTSRALRSAEAAIISTGRALQRMRSDQNATTASSRGLNTSIQALHGSLGSVRGMMATFGVGLAARGLVTIGNEFQRVRQTLVAVFGDTKVAAAEFNYLMTTANKLGLSFSAISDSYAQMAAAAKGTSLEGAKMRDIFEAVAETSTVMRFSVENTRGIIKAFEQMMSKGTVQAEELRNQLGDRLPGAFGIFVRAQFGAAEATQEMRSQFNDLMKKGKIVSEEILPKVAAELRKTFGPGLAAATQSAQAELSRMDNAFKALLLKGWDAGLEQSVKNLAMTLRSLFENENASKFMISFAQAMEKLTGIIFEFRGVLVPAIAAVAAFVAVFSVGTIITSLGRVFSVSKGMVGTFSALAGIAVAAASAFGFMGSKTGDAAASQKKMAEATGEAGKQLAALNQLTGGAGTDTLMGGIGQDALIATNGMYEYAAAVEAVRAAQASLAVTSQDVKTSMGGLDWGLMATAAIGGASVYGASRGKMGDLASKAGAKATGVPGMAATAFNAVVSRVPQGIKDGASGGFGKGADFGARAMGSAQSAAAGLSVKLNDLAVVQNKAWGATTKVLQATSATASAFSASTRAVGASAAAFGALRGVLGGVFALMGGWPGLVIGAIVAATVALVQFEKKKKEALNISAESKSLAQFYKDLAAATETPVAAANAEKITELAKVHQDVTTQFQKDTEARKAMLKDYEDSYEAHVKRVAELSSQVVRDSSGLAAAQSDMASNGRGDMGVALRDAVKDGEYQKALDLMRQFNVEVGSTPAVDRFQQMVQELVNSQKEADRLRVDISLIEKGIQMVVDAAIALTNELGKEVTKQINVVTVTSDQEKTLDKVRESVEDAKKYRGTNNQFDRAAIDVREIRSDLVDRSKTAGVAPDAGTLAQLDQLEKDALAESKRAAAKTGGGRARSAESRANSRQNDFAAAENKIYSVLDPVKAETVRLNEEVRDLTRALTRGGMSPADASKLVEQYRQVADQESKLTREIAKRSAQAEYLDSVGGAGRESALLKIENELDQFRMSATRAGMSVDDINSKVEQMRSAKVQELTFKFRGLEDAVRSASRAAGDAQVELMESFGVDTAGAKAYLDKSRFKEDIFKEREDARKAADEAIAAGSDKIKVEREYVTILDEINRKEQFTNALFERRLKLAQAQREDAANYSTRGLGANQAINTLNFIGGGQRGSNRVADLMESNPLVGRGILPEGDPDLLKKLPTLLREYGATADGLITPWYKKIQAIQDAVNQAKSDAFMDFNAGMRSNAALSDDEIGMAVSKGLENAGTDTMITRQQERADAMVNIWSQASDQLSGLFANTFSFDSEINSLRDFGFQFAQIMQAIIIEALRVAVIKPLISATFAAMGIPTFAQGGVVANAHGNVIHAFAKGMRPLSAFSNGVVNSPTYFGMGGGQTGLMGEAGSEAIIPLTRTRNGDLGVRSIGGGGGGNVYHIEVNTTIQGDVDGDTSAKFSSEIASKARDMIKGVAAEQFMEMAGNRGPVTI